MSKSIKLNKKNNHLVEVVINRPEKLNAVGIDPVHFGIIVTLNLAIGQQTPPVASVLVTACSVAKADIWDVTRSNISFICVLLVLLMLVTYVPAIPMTLVEFFYRS
jgi:TRAP-type C4-dicarboxylate transport system permease large subunit